VADEENAKRQQDCERAVAPVGEKHPIIQDAGLKSEVRHHERKTLAGTPLRAQVNPRCPRLFRSNLTIHGSDLNDYRTGMLTRCIPY
jgi:hypothetical protein